VPSKESPDYHQPPNSWVYPFMEPIPGMSALIQILRPRGMRYEELYQAANLSFLTLQMDGVRDFGFKGEAPFSR
jgi:hypothetical protein